jgi:hypothetical protein
MFFDVVCRVLSFLNVEITYCKINIPSFNFSFNLGVQTMSFSTAEKKDSCLKFKVKRASCLIKEENKSLARIIREL